MMTMKSKLSLVLYLTAFVSLIRFVLGHAGRIEVVNKCSYRVWPATSAIYINFSLSKDESQFIDAPSGQAAFQLWGRTGCKTNAVGNFTCQTGDSGSHQIDYFSNALTMPTTLVEFSFQNSNTIDFYDVSLVGGYNLPVMVAPTAHGCEATGCIFDVDAACPEVLKSDTTCASPCYVFKTSQYCCTSGECGPTDYSRAFKKACPRAYSYPKDDATSTFLCASSPYYVVTFCPSPHVMASAFSNIQTPSSSPSSSPSFSPSSSPSSVLSPTLSPTGSTKERKHRWRTYLLAAIPVATLFMVFLGLCIFMHKRRVKRRYINAQIDEIKSMESLQFDLNMIKAATRNFSVENKLGQGGFGEVYKGRLENGEEIAVKRLSKTSGQGVAEFKTEVVLVAKLQHKNLVRLLGFCVTSEEKILVYEYLPNSSLDKFIFDPIMSATLDWKTRRKIIIGVARGLLYLHEDSRLKVIHRDLKTSNVLLDQDMNPKISDFGLAKLFGMDETQGATERIVGTYGYMAPEYTLTGHYSVKSDVYSFGVIMLEIVSGQRSRFVTRLQADEEALLHRAWRLWYEGKALDLVDKAMDNNFSIEEVMKCIHIGLICIQEEAAQRPRMTSIVAAFSDHSINLPMPTPPRFFGNANVNAVQNDHAMDENNTAPWIYTGTNTITHLYPRE